MRLVIANAALNVWAVLDDECDAVLFMGSRSECERFMDSECVVAV